MFKIIGADKKEYGPVSADQLHRWISEGRANAQTLAQAEGSSEWKPLGEFPEFIEALRVHAPPPPVVEVPVVELPPESILERDYELDITGCVSRGWAVFKENMGVLIGVVLLMVVVALVLEELLSSLMHAVLPKPLIDGAVSGLALGYVSLAVSALISGPLMGGFYAVVLQTIRNWSANLGDIFSGFQKAFKHLFLGYLVTSLITGACLIPFNLEFNAKVVPVLEKFQNASASDLTGLMPQFMTAFVGVLPVLLICLIPMTYLSISWQFTLPLVMDKNLTFGAAMKMSWKMVGKHWWQVFGLTVLVGLLNVVGLLCCFVGLIFTIPVGFVAQMLAYETIFSAKKPQAR